MVIHYPVKAKTDGGVCSPFHRSSGDSPRLASHQPFLDAQAPCPCGRKRTNVSTVGLHIHFQELGNSFEWRPISLPANAL